MLDQLAAEGVDTGAVVVRDDAPTGMTVALSRGGDRAILTALGAVASLTAAEVPASLLAGARHVHASSWFLLEDSLGPGLAGLFSAARAGGATTSLDTNWDPAERWTGESLAHAIAAADLLLPNEAEALLLSSALSLDEAAGKLPRAARGWSSSSASVARCAPRDQPGTRSACLPSSRPTPRGRVTASTPA